MTHTWKKRHDEIKQCATYAVVVYNRMSAKDRRAFVQGLAARLAGELPAKARSEWANRLRNDAEPTR